jgi:hypothetical protein
LLKDKGQYMSRPDTLGFAPIVARRSVWRSDRGFARFIDLLHERVAEFAPDTAVAELAADAELAAVFGRSRALIGDDESPDDLAGSPPAAILEALDYAHEMYRGRVLLRQRLHAMRSRACAGAVQPRGTADPDRRTQLVAEVPHAGGHYQRFLAAQDHLRTRFA